MKLKPLKPDATEIAMLNAVIEERTNELRMYLRAAKEDATQNLPEEYQYVGTSYEQKGHSRGYIAVDRTRIYLDRLIQCLVDVRRLDNEISSLHRIKLHLFGDVDFQQGQAWQKAINKFKEQNK